MTALMIQVRAGRPRSQLSPPAGHEVAPFLSRPRRQPRLGTGSRNLVGEGSGWGRSRLQSGTWGQEVLAGGTYPRPASLNGRD
jgi:hypothetical protein